MGCPLTRIIGDPNTVGIRIAGIDTKALLDTGSQVTVLARTFYDEHLKDKCTLHSLNRILKVEVATGATLPYDGYIEVEIELPDEICDDGPRVVLALVVPGTEYNSEVPFTIGTNVLKLCLRTFEKKFSDQSVDNCKLDTPWLLALKCMSAGNANQPVMVNSVNSTLVPAGGTVTLDGLCTGKLSHGIIMTENFSPSSLPGGLLVHCRVIKLTDKNSNTVPVTLTNLTDKVLTIPSKTPICKIEVVTPVSCFSHNALRQNNRKDALSSQETIEELTFNLSQSDLSPEQENQAQNLLKKWKHVFSSHPTDLGHTGILKHKIKLTDETPFKERHRRIPPGMYEELRKHLQEMLECGAIRQSHSPWSSNIVLVRKSDGSLRVCQDFRKLNARTVKDSYALPRFEEVMDTLSGSSWFSSMDLQHGYLQMEVEEDDIPKTAFSASPIGFYECPRMPFGLAGAPASFQRLMERSLEGLTGTDCCIFLDDILVFSKTFQEHIEKLERVFERLDKNGLKLKPSKCNFFQRKVKFLGHIISAEGISTDPQKISAIQDWPRPQTVHELRRFLGFSGYYRRFVNQYSKIVKPLNDLLKGKTPRDSKGKFEKQQLDWQDSQEQAFQKIKHLLTTPPVLGFANYGSPFILTTDASLEGLGTVLYQEQDGVRRVIAYASRGLSKSEQHYPIHKLEFLALKWAVTEKFF